MQGADYAVPPAEKPCSKCGTVQPLSAYYVKREHGRERWASHCKACHLAITNGWQAKHREKVRALHRGYDAARLSRRSELARAYRLANPDVVAAQDAVNRAITAGLLTRPLACENCGDTPGLAHDGRSLIEGHHADYALPLDVKWLCATCHKGMHARR